MNTFDYVVVGSGCSGAMAAQTLVEGGVNVTMLDVGERDESYQHIVPDKDFISIRRTESDQYRYFIGSSLEGIGWGKVGKGEQITPPRKYINRGVDQYLAMSSDSFHPLESLAYGGLGTSWGLQCWEYSPAELGEVGLDPVLMESAYNTVSQRIGISATKDDAAEYTLGKLNNYQPSPNMDQNHKYIYGKYRNKKEQLHRQGLYIGRTPLALLTKDLDGRKKYAYRDMDFYSDKDQSAWRPWITVNSLKKKKNFNYLSGHLVLSFDEKNNFIEITCLETTSNSITTFRCKKMIIATGALGSARIVLRSYKKEGTRLPILCNPYTYIPCLQPSMFGREAEKDKLGFAQLSVFLDENKNNYDVSVGSLYSYQSLMLFRIIRQVPMAFSNARPLLRYLAPGIVILGTHHPDKSSDHKFLSLTADKSSSTGDRLMANYSLVDAEKNEFLRRERKIMKGMRSLSTYPIKRMDPGYGASIHYAGTLPFSDTAKEYSLAPNGRLHGSRSVYVADSSGFRYLPSRGLTFSLMANAHITAKGVLEDGK